MQLNLKNINKIEEASININGLTVVAGINDTGKSTIGKVLFALIKAINKISTHNEKNKLKKYQIQVSNFYFQLRRLEQQISENFIGVLFPKTAKEFVEEIIGDSGEAAVETAVYVTEGLEISPQQKARPLRCLNNNKEIICESNEPAHILANELQDSIEAEFLNNICTNNTFSSQISFIENSNTPEINIGIINNKIEAFSELDLEGFSIEDITFIESPLYIHLIDTLREAPTLKEQRNNSRYSLAPFINYHVKDLAQKLDAIRYIPQQPQLQFSDNLIDIEKINNIMGGKFVFDSQTKNIYWQKDGIKYSPVNVASGLKSFGVMQILAETQSINENRILVWDEPENHLHPEWQVRLAELMIEMSKAGIPILITSHSPYFIQSIRYFARKHELEKYVSYYLAEEQENGLSKIEEVTDDLNRVFYTLAQPMNEIINLGM